MKFAEIAVGEQFTHNGVTYVKTEPQKISCCKSLNATKVENNERVMFKPHDDVEKV